MRNRGTYLFGPVIAWQQAGRIPPYRYACPFENFLQHIYTFCVYAGV